jgi:uncharacterized lipoprotein YehR (DUF1307 family)
MKKAVFILLMGSLALVSCKKEEGNKGVIKEETPAAETKDKALIPGANSYTYRGMEGVRAKVSFNNTDKDNTVSIEANNNKFQLDKKAEINGEVQYERAGIRAIAKGDSLIIQQDGHIIPLAWDN